MHRLLDAGHRAAQIDFAGGVVQVVDRRVGAVIGAEHHLGLFRLVRGPAVGHRHRCQDHAFLVAQRDILADLDTFGKALRDIQGDRDRPQRAVGQAHILDDAIVIVFAQEPFQRVEAAIHQKLEVADLARQQIVAFEICGFDFQLLRGLEGHVELGDRSQVTKHGHVNTFGFQTSDGGRSLPVALRIDPAGAESLGAEVFFRAKA